jgi:hypothetical protein
MRTRQLHASLAYVMRVDNHASIAYAAASARSVRRGLLSPMQLVAFAAFANEQQKTLNVRKKERITKAQRQHPRKIQF